MGTSDTTETSRWRRIDTLLSEVLQLPPERHEQWLSQLSGEDQPLAPVIRSFLARTAVETDAFHRHLPAARDGERTSTDQPGTMVGPYRLIREIGAGGMGTVWLAERSYGSLRRQVAIKLPRGGWALGVAERLEQERDALAALEHPNIARLYDAGTDHGRPYLAMEYVDGYPIDSYAIENELSIEERLDLFLDVARAVSYAHAQLIVHRDLKPSNILVSPTSGVRLLDFGASKLLREESPTLSGLTLELGRALSPDYASPEQIRGDRVTVASDVYSLGVVLYELLTGYRPYRLPRGPAATLEAAIATADVPPASSRVCGDARLNRVLRGDLDTILAKALKSEVSERYQSVEAFADDISRYLSGKPVLAQPDSAAYRAAKFLRRHAFAVAAGTAIGLSLGIGGGLALWQARVARAEAARANRVKQFIASIFTEAAPRTGVGGVVTAADLLSSATARIDSELANDPTVAAELSVIIAEGFSNLGDPAKGEALLREASPRLEKAFGPTHPLTIRAKTLLASVVTLHDVEGALAIVSDVTPAAVKGLPATAILAVDALEQQSFILAKLNYSEASYAALRQAIAIGEQYLGPNNEETVWGMGLLSNTYGRFGDRRLQLETATRAFQRGRAAFGSKRPHLTLSSVERWYADALRTNDRPGDAVPILWQVLKDQQQLDVTPTVRVRHAQMELARALLATGRIEEGLPLLRAALVLEREQNAAESDDRRSFADLMAGALASAWRTTDALAEEDRLDGIVARLRIEPPAAAIRRGIRRGWLLACRGDAAESERAASEAVATSQDAELRSRGLLTLAFNARMQSRQPAALETLQRLALDDRLDSYPLQLQSAIAGELGTVLLDLGNESGAATQLERCRERFVRGQIEPSPLVATCLVGSARLALRDGRSDEAVQLLLPLVHSWERINPGSAWHGESLYWLAQAHAAKDPGLSQREASEAEAMLRKSRLPALRRLVDPPLTSSRLTFH